MILWEYVFENLNAVDGLVIYGFVDDFSDVALIDVVGFALVVPVKLDGVNVELVVEAVPFGWIQETNLACDCLD